MSPSQIRNLSNFDDIEIPEREYGYRKEPFQWDELVDIISVEKNLAKLCRSEEQQKIYMVYRKELLKEYASVYDHILVSKFGFEKKKRVAARSSGGGETRLQSGGADDSEGNNNNNENGNIRFVYQAHPPLSEIQTVQKALKPNDFPYHTADGIEHWCLWKLLEDVTDEEITEAKSQLRRMHQEETQHRSNTEETNDHQSETIVVTDFLSWRNPPHLKSLPDIDHIHILCRTRQTDGSGETGDDAVMTDNNNPFNSSQIYTSILQRYNETGTMYMDKE